MKQLTISGKKKEIHQSSKYKSEGKVDAIKTK